MLKTNRENFQRENAQDIKSFRGTSQSPFISALFSDLSLTEKQQAQEFFQKIMGISLLL